MTSQFFTDRQIAWAKQHDWFVSVDGEGLIVCRSATDEVSHVRFHSFTTLRSWAGY